MSEKLRRNVEDGVFGGVCAGISDYCDAEAWLVRVFFFGSMFFGGTGLLIYILLWLFMPRQR